MSFGVPISYRALNAIATADTYPEGEGTASAYRLCAGCARVNIDISNAAVFFQLGIRSGGGILWSPERYLLPSFRSLERRFDAIRFRSALAGTPAIVTADPLTPNDIGGA